MLRQYLKQFQQLVQLQAQHSRVLATQMAGAPHAAPSDPAAAAAAAATAAAGAVPVDLNAGTGA